jgi:hypothetical protein
VGIRSSQAPSSTDAHTRVSAGAARRQERAALDEAHRHLGDIESWFIKRGLPHFIENYKATDDIFSRTLPLIVLLIIFQMGLELSSKDVTWGDRVIGGVVGVVCVLGLFLVANLIRQRRLWWRLPKRVGLVEMALLVVLGPVVGLVASASMEAVGINLAANVGLFLVVYGLVAYAILPVIMWAVSHAVREVKNLVRLASKALPMLALFGTFLFLNVDMWHIASYLDRADLWRIVGFFSVVTLLFLVARLPEEIRSLTGSFTRETVSTAAAGTPLARHLDEIDDILPQLRTTRRQRLNMLFVLGFTQIIQILLLSLVVFAYFITLGKIAVKPGQVADWMRVPECEVTDYHQVEEIAAKCKDPEGWMRVIHPGHFFGLDARIPGTEVVFSDPLIQTALLLTTFSAFFFAVSAVTDEAYRKDFFESITAKLTKSLEIRCGYIHLYLKAAANVGGLHRFGGAEAPSATTFGAALAAEHQQALAGQGSPAMATGTAEAVAAAVAAAEPGTTTTVVTKVVTTEVVVSGAAGAQAAGGGAAPAGGTVPAPRGLVGHQYSNEPHQHN